MRCDIVLDSVFQVDYNVLENKRLEQAMKLNLQTIQDITSGAVRVTQADDGFHFFRFTSRQEALYKTRNEGHYKRTFCTSGVQLAFQTNSEKLLLKVSVSPITTRRYFAFEVFVNGTRIGSINNFEGVELPRSYTTVTLPLGEFENEFTLGTGQKDVRIYFPWAVEAVLQEITLDDGAIVTPLKRKKKLLCFGDSITQGFDALYSSNKYISQLADALDAEEFNKAIGGEIFFPALAQEKDDFVPDYITVAYGTNDWSACTEETFRANCKAFFTNLVENYPETKIYAITPTWRKDHTLEKPFGAFEKVEQIVRSIAAEFENITVISGFDFVPHDENYFADLRLHPNDEGFKHYFANLIKKLL